MSKILIAYFSRRGNNYAGGSIPDMNGYDVVYLGYPNWWGTMPMGVFTFLEQYDFSGKRILPFCTHEGSGMGHSEIDIKKLWPEAGLLKGLAIRGTDTEQADDEMRRWIKKSEELSMVNSQGDHLC